MQITFNEGEAGYREARALQAIARYARSCDPHDGAEMQVIDVLQAAAEDVTARPEFASLAAADDGGGWPGERESLWRRWFGPSRREQLLSEQRGAALERAERAEQSSFEALGETARIARERDEARARIVELEQALAEALGSR